MTAKVGSREAWRRAKREEAALAAVAAHQAILKGVTAPRKQGPGEPKRMGRPPDLKKADYDAVEAATRDLLATALKHYLRHTAKNKVRNSR